MIDEPHIFEQFPPDAVCPVCKTSDSGECVLLQIDGTSDGAICDGQPVHVRCAVATNFNREMGVIYRRIYPWT